MSVFKGKRRRTFQYDFWYGGQHYRGNTYQETKEDAKLVEAQIKLRLRHQRGGIAPTRSALSITSWAGTYFEHILKMQRRTGRPKRPDMIEHELHVVLRFWGARPEKADSPVLPQPGEEAPFHNLTLQDPIDDPMWIERFEDWIDRRKVAGSTRNHYLSRMSQLYAVALMPKYRALTGVSLNPFTGVVRSPNASRKVVLTPQQVLDWLAAMSYHARLAVSIAALAPKLRLRNILTLERHQIDPDVTTITVWSHKADASGRPLIVPISDQLRTILLDAFERMAPNTTKIVQYRGTPIRSLRRGIQNAAKAAGIPYGRYHDQGVTFHTLRHTASTLLARLKVNPWIHRDAIGHAHLHTSEGYTHLEIEEQRPALEQLSQVLPVADLVTASRRRAARVKGQVGGPAPHRDHGSATYSGSTRGSLIVPGRPFRKKA